MTWLGRLGSSLTRRPRNDGAGRLPQYVYDMFVRPSKSGQSVTVKTAPEVSAVFGLLRVLGDGVGQPPLKLFRERPDGRGSDPERNHGLYPVLYRRPNGYMTSFRLRETMMWHLALTGNFFSFKNVVKGQVRELLPFDPGYVTVKQNKDWSLSYKVRDDQGVDQEIPAAAMWHVRGPSWNGYSGLEIVKLAREAIGLSMALEETAANLQKNGLRSPGVYAVSGSLEPKQHADLYEWLKQYLPGGDKHGGPLLLDRDAKYTATGISPIDAEQIAQRHWEVEEMCRFFRVMPIMIGRADRGVAWNGAEQMFLAHVVHTLCPWYERLQQEIDTGLLVDPQGADNGVYSKFIVGAMLHGALRDQAEYFSRALGAGGSPAWLTQNEVREMIEFNHLPGGDVLHAPTMPAVPASPPEPPPPQPAH